MANKTSIRLAKGLRLFRTTYTDDAGQQQTAAKWYIEFRFGGRPRRVPAFTDKGQSIELARNLHRLVMTRESGGRIDGELSAWLDTMPDRLRARLVEIGLLDAQRQAAAQLLTAHLDDWQAAIVARGSSDEHAAKRRQRVGRIFTGCEFVVWSDLVKPGAGTRVQTYLGKLRKLQRGKAGGINGQTIAHYLSALGGFCRWMVGDRRATALPFESLQGVYETETDRRHERRALTIDEVRQLIQTAADGPERYGIAPADRALLYRFAFETGLRPKQIRGLTVASFDLSAEPPTLTAQAGTVKRRKRHTQPLMSGMAAELARRFAHKLPGATAFAMPRETDLAKMFRQDLAAARTAWLAATESDVERTRRHKSDYLLDRSHGGLVADFYSLRHTTGTALSDLGVSQKTIQTWLHHAQSRTTDRYLHTHRETAARVLDLMPDVKQREKQQATGTDGGPAQLGALLGAFRGLNPDNVDESGQLAGAGVGSEKREKSGISEAKEIGSARIRTENQGIMSPLGVSSNPTSDNDLGDYLKKLGVLLGAFPELRELIDAWPTLPDKARAGILAMLRAARQT